MTRVCVALIVDNASKPPTLEEYQEMEATNDDGAGVGWADPSRRLCHWSKGLDAEAVHKLVTELLDSGTTSNILVHFRWATVGGRDKGLTHPFVVNKEAGPITLTGTTRNPLLIHNGHWGDWSSYQKVLKRKHPTGDDKTWSDTRVAARLIAMKYLGPEEVDGKVAILRADGGVQYWGDWKDEGGVLYSNTYWRGGGHKHRYGKGTTTYEAYPGPGHSFRDGRWVPDEPKKVKQAPVYTLGENGLWYKDGVVMPETEQWRKTKEETAKLAASKTPADLPEITVNIGSEPEEEGTLFSRAERAAMRLETHTDGSRIHALSDSDYYRQYESYADDASELLSSQEKDAMLEVVLEGGCPHTEKPGKICAHCFMEFDLKPADLRGTGITCPVVN